MYITISEIDDPCKLDAGSRTRKAGARTTQRDGKGREVAGGFGSGGHMCTPTCG